MRAALSLLILALPPLASAQTPNCKLAQSPRAKAVCADTRLTALNAEITSNYNTLRDQLSPESAALVESDQNEWLHWIDLLCPANGKGSAADQTKCLQNQYFTRAHDLDKITHLDSMIIFPRAHFLYKAGTAPPTDPVDPGFGYGSLRWPQIDKPTPEQAAFNTAVKTKAAQLAVPLTEKPATPPTFDTAINAAGTVEAYFTIDAANDNLINVTLTDGTYGWGAAHPNTSSTSFIWWLDRSRELTAADIFQSSSAWQQKLVTLAIDRLNANPDLKNNLWKGDQLTKGVQQAAPDPRNWTVTRDDLTITFGQYIVGPYFIAMPEAHINWDQLTDFLVPGLHLITLPAPIPKSNP